MSEEPFINGLQTIQDKKTGRIYSFFDWLMWKSLFEKKDQEQLRGTDQTPIKERKDFF
jgi:hypothetical protein